ncbi:MAG TPA: recombinase family protein [Dehalococcoidia bacterium]|nr:recombinase family protein [Dehalococcoidia bacterium]
MRIDCMNRALETSKAVDNAFVIIRVSAEDQLKGYGPDVQWEDDILPVAPELDLKVSETYRRVIQESATGWQRTKFEAAIREALALYHHGDIDALLFPRVDRETRFVFGSFPLLAEVVRSGLRVYFAREKLLLNPSDPESVERYLNKATQAQAYVQTMKVNTSRAKHKLLREGKLPQGTGVGIYGYSWDRTAKKRIIKIDEAEVVKEIFTLVVTGHSLVSIAKGLNERRIPTKGSKNGEHKHWHSLTIRRMVRNPSYIGKTYFGVTSRLSKSKTVTHPRDEWILLEQVTPPIISEELFDHANAQLDKPKARTGHPKHEYLLRGHAFCVICGRPLVGHCLNKKYRYYQCSNARPYENSDKKCRASYIRADGLEEVVWSKTREVLSNPEIVLCKLTETSDKASLDSLDTEIKELENTLRNYEKRRSNLLEAMELGEFEKDEILDRLNNIKRLRHEDDAKLNGLLRTREHLASLANAKIKLSELYDRVLENLMHSTPEIKKLAFDALDIRVYASRDTTEIRGVIPLELALPTTEQTSA